MPIYVLAACFAVALSLPVAGVAALSSRHDRMVRRNLRIADRHRSGLLLPVRTETGLQELIDRISTRLRPLTPLAYIDHLERRINIAGWGHRITVDHLMVGKAALVVATLLFGVYQAAGGTLGWILVSVPAALLLFVMPDMVLDRIGQGRQTKIERELPDILDQLTISIEAGLGFDASLRRVVDTNDGPLAQEFTHTLQDIQFGMPRDEAIEKMIDRTDVIDLRLFASALNQANRYGVPLGHVMRLQASDLREKRQFRAEERAAKIPVKISMPLVFCILPVLFIVLIGPAAIRISQTGFGG